MKLKPGHTIDELTLPSIDGSQFDIKTLNKKEPWSPSTGLLAVLFAI